MTRLNIIKLKLPKMIKIFLIIRSKKNKSSKNSTIIINKNKEQTIIARTKKVLLVVQIKKEKIGTNMVS